MINNAISFPSLQPIVDMYGTTKGYEVLMRILYKNQILFPKLIFSLYSPRDVEKIEEEIHQKALAILRETYIRDTNIFISINLCLSRWNKTLVSYIDKLSKNFNISLSSIVVELSELFYFSQDYEILGVINKLKTKGVRIALDDFGDGITDIRRVCQIPFDFIKVNISLCRLPKFGKLLEVLKDKDTDTCLVAERVETHKDFMLAERARFDLFQGRYCHKFYNQREQEEAVSVEFSKTGRFPLTNLNK